MSEFWVSRNKYYCKYCKIYIADDVPSRQMHENGLRHKGNKDRFIRDLYKTGEKMERDKLIEAKEMKAIDAAAAAAYAKDVGYAAASQVASSSSVPKLPPKSVPKSTDKWANYSTAASLGIVDTEAEIAAAKASIKQKEGRVGDWQIVSVVEPLPEVPSAPILEQEPAPVEPFENVALPQKRPREPSPEDPDDLRRFRVREKTSVGLSSDIFDPGVIHIKKREDSVAAVAAKPEEDTAVKVEPKIEGGSQWSHSRWAPAEQVNEAPDDLGSIYVKPEDANETTADISIEHERSLDSPKVKSEDSAQSIAPLALEADDTSLFKKRRPKAATAGVRRKM